MLIFLDIDGVLRPRGAPMGVLEEGCRARFEALVRERAEVRIVVSSDWRLVMRLEEIRAHFSPEVAARVIGETPCIAGSEPETRYREVLAYLRAERRHLPWVALDDDPWHYPPQALDVTLVLTDPAVGFDERAAARLRRLLAGEAGDPDFQARRRRIETGGGR